jgi:hypothetical protein
MNAENIERVWSQIKDVAEDGLAALADRLEALADQADTDQLREACASSSALPTR